MSMMGKVISCDKEKFSAALPGKKLGNFLGVGANENTFIVYEAVSAGGATSTVLRNVAIGYRALLTQAVISEDIIKGSVIHIDNYGNVIVNITEQLFQKVGKGNPFTIYFRQKTGSHTLKVV